MHLENWRNYGASWWGVKDFDPGENLQLKLVVADGRQALFHGNKLILTVEAWPEDLALRIMSDTPDSATIYRCSFRKLKEEDLKDLQWEMPSRNLALKTEETAARLDKAKAGLQNSAEQGKRFVVGATDAPMAWVPPGTFAMGSRDPKNAGRHRVRLTKGFWMGQYEVTQQEWLALMKSNPSRIQGSPYLPVDWVSWQDAMGFCQALTKSEQIAGRLPAGYEYRLPTEAEWEYACRAGSDEDFSVRPEDVWSRDRSGWRPHEVGEKPPNARGLYDMLGNAMEWCNDAWYDYPNQTRDTVVDPVHPGHPERDAFVVRGGACWLGIADCSSFWREKNRALAVGGFRGFRIVLGPRIAQASQPNK